MGVFNELKLRMDDLHRTSEVQQMNLHQGLGAVNQIQVNQKQEDQRLRAIEQQIPKPWAEWESVADLPIVVIMCVLFKNMMIIVESPKCGWFCYTVTQGDDVADSSDGDFVGNADLRPNWNVRRVSDVSDDQHVDLGFFKADGWSTAKTRDVHEWFVSAMRHWTVQTGDIKTAFLNGDKTEYQRAIYAEPPEEVKGMLGMESWSFYNNILRYPSGTALIARRTSCTWWWWFLDIHFAFDYNRKLWILTSTSN